jgi:DNA-binding transcriptional LysR family regulator
MDMSASNRLAKLELKQLRVLRALLRERNVSRVAEQLGVSQQTVSEQLKRLRDIFDDRLFVRTSNGIIPTPVAERLSPRLDKVLSDVELLLEGESFDPALVDGILNISATDFEQRAVLPKLLKRVRQQAPGLKVIVHKLEIDQMGQQLLTGQIDLVFSTPNFVPNNCPTMLLYKENYVCVSAKGRYFDSGENKILLATEMSPQGMSPKEIVSFDHIVVSPSRGDLRGMADDWFEAKGLKRNVVLSVPSFAAAAECVAETDTLAFLPSRLLPDPRLQQVHLTEYPPGFDVIAAWHVRSGQDPLHLWIRGLLKEFKIDW